MTRECTRKKGWRPQNGGLPRDIDFFPYLTNIIERGLKGILKRPIDGLPFRIPCRLPLDVRGISV